MSVGISDRSRRDVLGRDEARARASRIRDVRYHLEFDLRAGEEVYAGRARLAFDVIADGAPLFLDFSGDVLALRVDGAPVSVERQGHRLLLPSRLTGPTEVEVDYRNRYDHTGDGFHRFVDPEDGEEYVYSNFQPFAAHRLFPCFDQPDLKATYRLAVTAPADWEVISATRAESVTAIENGLRRHRFEVSRPFSTYLLALVAGPYQVVREEHDGIPLGVYGRRSMARILEHDATEILEITRQGFDFYRRLFAQPYPFSKYDQLFMPEFNAGAMENVGAVTFHDSFLFRDPPTDSQRLERAEVILHELAHMWFGNLVTMTWWDDLWLNESFATYISFLAMDQATRFHGSWQTFNGSMKPAAMRQDQLVTTHPVAADVRDTDAALLNFDGITYEKGASVLKQLVATIGEEAFAQGMRRYFERHAWGNATLADFLAALEDASGRRLGDWAEVWLRTPSINTIAASWTASNGVIDRLTLSQTAPPEHPWLRPHAMELALLRQADAGHGDVAQDGAGQAGAGQAGAGHGDVAQHGAGQAGAIQNPGRLIVESVPASISGASVEVAAAAGRPRPLLVFANHRDLDYAKTTLDPVSLGFARQRLDEVDDPFLRQLLWTTLWDMVRDARLSSTEYLAICRRLAPREPDPDLLDAILERAMACLAAYVPDERRQAEAGALVATALTALRHATHEDPRITWLRTAIAVSSSAQDIEQLLALADGRERIAGVEVDQEMRWGLATRAVAMGVKGAEGLIEREAARDRSDRGARAVVKAAAARPDPVSKAETWRRINDEGYGSYYLTRAAMQGFRWHHQRALLEPYREPFFEGVRTIFATQDHPWARAYLAYLFPSPWAEPQVVLRAQELLSTLSTEENTLERQLRETIDELERSIRVRAYAAASSSV
jgi:aminopeptidase N